MGKGIETSDYSAASRSSACRAPSGCASVWEYRAAQRRQARAGEAQGASWRAAKRGNNTLPMVLHVVAPQVEGCLHLEVACDRMQWNLQPYVMEDAALCSAGRNPMQRRLQPRVTEAATPRDGGCRPVRYRL